MVKTYEMNLSVAIHNKLHAASDTLFKELLAAEIKSSIHDQNYVDCTRKQQDNLRN